MNSGVSHAKSTTSAGLDAFLHVVGLTHRCNSRRNLLSHVVHGSWQACHRFDQATLAHHHPWRRTIENPFEQRRIVLLRDTNQWKLKIVGIYRAEGMNSSNSTIMNDEFLQVRLDSQATRQVATTGNTPKLAKPPQSSTSVSLLAYDTESTRTTFAGHRVLSRSANFATDAFDSAIVFKQVSMPCSNWPIVV